MEQHAEGTTTFHTGRVMTIKKTVAMNDRNNNAHNHGDNKRRSQWVSGSEWCTSAEEGGDEVCGGRGGGGEGRGG